MSAVGLHLTSVFGRADILRRRQNRGPLVAESMLGGEHQPPLQIDLLGQMVEQRVIQGGLGGRDPLFADGLEILHRMPADFLQRGQAAFFLEEIRLKALEILAESAFNEPRELDRMGGRASGASDSIR